MPTPIYPSWNDKEFDLLKKMTENTALIADYEIGDVASVAGTANQLLVNGGTAAATGNIILSLPSSLVAPGSLTVTGETRISDGTAAAPSLAPSSATTTGFYKYNASALGFSSSGSHSLLFGTDGTIYGANLGTTLSMPAAGGVTLSTGGTNKNITLTPSGTGTNVLNKGLSVLNTIGQFSGTGAPASGAGVEVGMLGTTQGLIFAYNRTTSAALPLSLQHAGGALLIGTTSDGGQKLQVAGDTAMTGNLTVSGTGQQTFLGRISSSHSTAGSSSSAFVNTASNGYGLLAQGGSTLASTQYVFRAANYLNADAFVVYSDSATLAGNLTVSGTGTSTFNGPLKVLPGTSGGGYLNLNYTVEDVYFETQRWAGSAGIFSATRIMGGSFLGGFLKFLTSNDAAIGSQVFTERMRLNANGNLLLGTTTDGGQKLQVNGTAAISSTLTVSGTGTSSFAGPLTQTNTAAGVSASFGAATSLNGNGVLEVVGSNGSSRAANQWVVASNGNSTIYVGSTAGTASSGTAVLSLGAAQISSAIAVNLSSATASTSTTTGALVVSGGVGVAGAVNVGGAIAIGNTVQTAASVASTHKVTISIGGVTYYLLATNV